MNSLSYLDSVLSRSFAAVEQRSSSSSSSSSPPPNKRSRSHSSLPSTRRASSTSSAQRTSSSSLRRWSQEQDGVDPNTQIYNSRLKRTGSTPTGIDSAHALDTDDSADDRPQQRTPRWSGLWGLTGWLDEAIHPDAVSRPRNYSDSEKTSQRPAGRMLSLDDLLLTPSTRSVSRRATSSSSGSRRHRSGHRTSEEENEQEPRRSKRRSRMAASLTLTVDSSQDLHNRWQAREQKHAPNDDPDLMSEKEREDIVDFVGGDFAADDTERQRERSVSLGSVDSNWADGSSLSSHERASNNSVCSDEQQQASTAAHAPHDTFDERHVDEETLLDAAKGEPDAMEAVAQEDPSSSVANPDSSNLTPTKHRIERDLCVTHTSTEQVSQETTASDELSTTPGSSSRTTPQSRSKRSLTSSSDSSLRSSDSEQTLTTRNAAKMSKRKRSSRSASAISSENEREQQRGWLASRSSHAKSGRSAPPKYRKFSFKCTIRKALVTLRALIVGIIMCPVQCVRYLRGRRAIKAQEMVDLVYQRAQVPILEKEPESRFRSRPPSSRLASKVDSDRDVGKATGHPHTPDSDTKVSTVHDEEPVTEEQAAKNGAVWKALRARTPSRLLPNPHRIDPMLAHDRKALPIDEGMAEKEARMEAERQARIAKGRAARRAAASNAASNGIDTNTMEKTVAPLSTIVSKIPRNPTSSVIHHTPKILVLDLDETLIHSTSRSPSQYIGLGGGRTTTSGFLGLEAVGAVLGLRANDNPRRIRPHMVEVVLDGRSVLYHVYKRPWVDYFLRKVASWYTVVVFTASVQEYADPVIDWLDQGRGLISARLFRESCSFKNGSYVKNLEVVDQDLAKVCLVDNSPASYAINRANGVPIEGWTHDPNDEALLDLLPILDSLRFATDVRHILGIRGFSSPT